MRRLAELNNRFGIPVMLFFIGLNLVFVVTDPSRWWNWFAAGLCALSAAFTAYVRRMVKDNS